MQRFQKLAHSFYNRPDVVGIARELIGKILVTRLDGRLTAGKIVETEAYAGETDMASHARNGRRTARTEVMYGPAAVSYVYLCYGIHQMFNVVTNSKDIPHAILIRALEPLEGINWMLERTGKAKPDHTLTRGPGNVARAMGLHTGHTGTSLLGNRIFIAGNSSPVATKDIIATPRIGVDYAGEDASLLYRFILKNNPYVSGPKKSSKTTAG